MLNYLVIWYFQMLNLPCIPEVNPTWSWYISPSWITEALLCRATQDGRVIAESSDETWSIEGGNGTSPHYTCREKTVNYIQGEKDNTLKDESPRSEGIHYATGEEQRRVHVRINTDIIGISKQKRMGMGEFNSENHYIYYCGQESLRRNRVALITNSLKYRTWVQPQKGQNDLGSFPRQAIQHYSNPSLGPYHWCWRNWTWSILWRPRRPPRTNTKKEMFYSSSGIGMQK